MDRSWIGRVPVPSEKELPMCMNCGCGEINERHGNEANIVAEDVRRAGQASGQDLLTTARNLETSLRQMSEPGMVASGVGGQPGIGSSTTGRMSSGSEASNG